MRTVIRPGCQRALKTAASVLFFAALPLAAAAADGQAQAPVRMGNPLDDTAASIHALLARGDLAAARRHLNDAIDRMPTTDKQRPRLQVMLLRVLEQTGDHHRAITIADELSAKLRDDHSLSIDSPLLQATLIRARYYFRARLFERADGLLRRLRTRLPKLADEPVLSLAQADYRLLRGDLEQASYQTEAARKHWQTVVRGELANKGMAQLLGRAPYAAINRLLDAVSITSGPGKPAPTAADTKTESGLWQQTVQDASVIIERRPTSADNTIAMLDLSGRLARQGFAETAQQWLEAARRQAKIIDNQFITALVAGRSAQSALRAERHDQALSLARKAVFLSQSMPALRYQWEWTIARVFRQQRKFPQAVRSYQSAVSTLESVREQGAAPIEFDYSGRLYFELADLLLGQSPGEASVTDRQQRLKAARLNVEKSKAAELRDYFRDDCVTAFQSKFTTVDNLPPRTAAIYPIVLDDRIELLVTLPGRMLQKTVAVGRERLSAETLRFRRLLEQRTTRRYLRPAQQLYDWLIRPVLAPLESAGVDNLIIIPEGPLRTVPAAALHDGQQFLVEQFALATTPGLQLTADGPNKAAQGSTLIGGVSDAVQGFAALSHVPAELRAVTRHTKGKQLTNRGFESASFARELVENQYSVVHVASHAQFDADPDKTFLLTYDGRIGLNRLSELIGAGRFRDRGLDLLTLSACQTAAGDERSALGLAGAAVRSGAAAVLASLWSIDDAASARLLSVFYEQLFDGRQTKARSLRAAQQSLLTDRRFRHPAYWSPFILIGNWQ